MLIVVIVALKKSPIDRIYGQISSLVVVRGNEDGANAPTFPLSGVASCSTLSGEIELGATTGTSRSMYGEENA